MIVRFLFVSSFTISTLFSALPQEYPLDLLENTSGLNIASWRIGNLQTSMVEGADPRFGARAVRFDGDSGRDFAKGDIGIYGALPEGVTELALSVMRPEQGNVKSVGFQIRDAEGEMLLYTEDFEGSGWQRFSIIPGEADFEPAYRQDDKNGVLDLPIQAVNFVWFTEEAGPTAVVIDGLTAKVENVAADRGLQFELGERFYVEAGEPVEAAIGITNFLDESKEVTFEYNVQLNQDFFDRTPPDSKLGRNEAFGVVSWTDHNGQRVSEGTLTDREANTAYGFPWGSDVLEAEQVIDLGEVKSVSHLTKQAGDANWIFKVDILSSTDGREYESVEGWQGLDWKGEWGSRTIEADQPFEARFIKFRYHNDGEAMQTLRLPTKIAVFNGRGDDPIDFPNVGELVDSGTITVKVPARGFAVSPIRINSELGQGAFLLSVRAKGKENDETWLSWSNLLVLPEAMESFSEDSPFGINSSTARLVDWNRTLGTSWVRFENLKWPMVSPEPDVFAFDGSVGPWHMNVDEYVKTYIDQGMFVLPYLFQVPVFESAAPEGVEKNIKQYPPKDFDEYGKFIFQTVARYGSQKHPDDVLLTEDKVSGLGWMDTYEIWNEPNLNDPGWGHWVGEYDDYLDLFRIAAEQVKRADPTAKVSNGGLAGTELGLVDRFRSYQYPDGKRPLDFMDVINVHHYTQPFAPEIATINTNIDRSGEGGGELTFEENLIDLSDWRDLHKPEAEIWLTETGFDSGGPRGVSLRTKAAYTPRNIMTILGSGIDKVFVFREMGSNPILYGAAGMLDEDGNPKGAFLTYATLIRVMEGAEGFRRLPHPNPNVRVYGATKDGEPVIAAWAIEGTERLDIDLGSGQITGPFGHTERGEIGEDFELTIFPNYFEGVDKEKVRDLFLQANKIKKERLESTMRRAQLNAALFDFGDEKEIGAVTVGKVRPFTPVLADTLYSEEQGYGFSEPHDLRENILHGWLRDPLERDGIKIIEGNVFRFDVPPGNYQLSFKIGSLGGDAEVVARGVTGDETKWTVTREAKVVEAQVSVTTGPVEIALPNDYGAFYWISMIEVE